MPIGRGWRLEVKCGEDEIADLREKIVEVRRKKRQRREAECKFVTLKWVLRKDEERTSQTRRVTT